MKRGKSWALNHIAKTTSLAGLNTAVVSLEMNEKNQLLRYWQSLLSLAKRPDEGKKYATLEFSYFLDPTEKYRAIEYDKIRIQTKDLERPLLNENNVRRALEKVKRFEGLMGTIYFKSFPAFSAGVPEIEEWLEYLESIHGFTPHVLCVDYLGAMRPPARTTGRDPYNQNSQLLKGMAQSRKLVCFSAHQGTRATLEKEVMKEWDVSEDIRVLANGDILLGLNQTEWEKGRNFIRINVLAHRHEDYSSKRMYLVLQQLKAGQFCLDSREIKYEIGKKVSI